MSSFSVRVDKDASDTKRSVRTRTFCLLEVNSINLNHHLSRSSRLVVLMPTEFNPDNGFLRWKNHLPVDPSSENVFYNTLLDQYMDRHYDLMDVLYSGWVANYIMKNKPCRKSAAEDSDSSDDKDDDHDRPVSYTNNRIVSAENSRSLR